jgi:diguanylate cyclase (GGDEF)-like protein
MLSELAMHDSLTALPNRRSLFIDLGRLCRQARRDQIAFAVAMVDVDHFKAYNDQFGHMSGDVCLQKLAEVLNQAAQRPLDTAGRYGGEEFTLIWYDCSPAQARELAEKLRQEIEALNITQADRIEGGVITVSVGVCLCPVGGDYTEEMVIQRADEALYQAKDDGRNRVVMHEMHPVDNKSA